MNILLLIKLLLKCMLYIELLVIVPFLVLKLHKYIKLQDNSSIDKYEEYEFDDKLEVQDEDFYESISNIEEKDDLPDGIRDELIDEMKVRVEQEKSKYRTIPPAVETPNDELELELYREGVFEYGE